MPNATFRLRSHTVQVTRIDSRTYEFFTQDYAGQAVSTVVLKDGEADSTMASLRSLADE